MLPSSDGSNKPTSSLSKHWFGGLTDWLKKVTTVEASDVGYLSMIFDELLYLYHYQVGCSQSNAMASLDIYLKATVDMEATYAYYFEGTIVPPSISGTYAHFGLEPSAYLGLEIQGYAKAQYATKRT